MNLTYINVAFTGKVLRWKMYLQGKDFDLYHVAGKEEHQFVPDALSRLCVNHIAPPPTLADESIVALRPVMNLPQDVYDRIADIHNSLRGHVGLKLCKRRFKMVRKQRIKTGLTPEDAIPDRMINEFLRQCPYCQITNRLRLEVLHLDHIGPLTKDAHGNEYILVIIDAFSRWVELFPTKSTTAAETVIYLSHLPKLTCISRSYGLFYRG